MVRHLFFHYDYFLFHPFHFISFNQAKEQARRPLSTDRLQYAILLYVYGVSYFIVYVFVFCFLLHASSDMKIIINYTKQFFLVLRPKDGKCVFFFFKTSNRTETSPAAMATVTAAPTTAPKANMYFTGENGSKMAKELIFIFICSFYSLSKQKFMRHSSFVLYVISTLINRKWKCKVQSEHVPQQVNAGICDGGCGGGGGLAGQTE